MLFFQDKTLKNLNLTSLFEGGGPPAGGGRSSRPQAVEGVRLRN